MNLRGELKFAELRQGMSQNGRPYHYRSLQLPWKDDFVNVIVPVSKERFLAGTEQGRLLLYDLHRNKLIGTIKTDQWVSGTRYHTEHIWSVGADRKIMAHKLKSGKLKTVFCEDPEHSKYPDFGIIFKETSHSSYVIYNCGFLCFKLLNQRTHKVVRKFNICHFLASDPLFRTFDEPNRVVRSFCVSKKKSLLYSVVNRYNPYLVVFDFKRMRLVSFNPVYPKIDSSVFLQVGTHLLSYEHKGLILYIIQLRRKKTQKIESYFRRLQYDQEFPDHSSWTPPQKIEGSRDSLSPFGHDLHGDLDPDKKEAYFAVWS